MASNAFHESDKAPHGFGGVEGLLPDYKSRNTVNAWDMGWSAVRERKRGREETDKRRNSERNSGHGKFASEMERDGGGGDLITKVKEHAPILSWAELMGLWWAKLSLPRAVVEFFGGIY